MPAVKDSVDYQEYMKLETRPLGVDGFLKGDEGEILIELGELFCRYQKDENDEDSFCVVNKRFGTSNALRQHVSKHHGAINDSKGGKPTTNDVEDAWHFYKFIMKEHARLVRRNEERGEIATAAAELSLLGSAGKIPLHSEKKKKLAGKIIGSAARTAVKEIGLTTFPCENCKHEKDCCGHKNRGSCEYMKYFTDVPAAEEANDAAE